MATIVDSYDSDQNTFQRVGGFGVTVGGQSFTGDGSTLDSAQFYLKKNGSPTGNAVCNLYAHTGTYGTSSNKTGTALATSVTFDTSTLTASYVLTTFNFTGVNRVTMTNGTNYVIEFEYTGTNTNNVDMAMDSLTPTHPGNANNGSSLGSTFDIDFYVYGVASDFIGFNVALI